MSKVGEASTIVSATAALALDDDQQHSFSSSAGAEDDDVTLLESEIASYERRLCEVAERRTIVRARVEEAGVQVDGLVEHANALEKSRLALLSVLQSVALRTESHQRWLDLTRRTNATNDCFHIWHRGQYGTINGLRLGGEVDPVPTSGGDDAVSGHGTNTVPESDVGYSSFFPDVLLPGTHNNAANTVTPNSNSTLSPTKQQTLTSNPPTSPSTANPSPSSATPRYNHFKVPWSEINAALGTAALLLSTLEENPNSPVAFRSYRIHPQGNFSTISVLHPQHKPVSYNLFYDNDESLLSSALSTLYGRQRGFNTALNALLACLGDAAVLCREVDRTIGLPHEIEADSTGQYVIGGLSLAYGPDGERWTRALKYFLTDLKWLSAFTVKHVDV